MADYQLIIIGGGLSGLAAGIRSARFGRKTLILEQHHLPGGLNSYYFRHGHLLETGLHAMTNYAEPGDRHAPLNRLWRQLKLSRKQFATHRQLASEIVFPRASLTFSNDFDDLLSSVRQNFPAVTRRFLTMTGKIREYDPFSDVPRRSARDFLRHHLNEPLLEDMLLLPLMVYGNAEEHDMDLGQFVIMFRALFLEGFFRPRGTIREFLDLLVSHYRHYDGELRFRAPVRRIFGHGDKIHGVELEDGERLTGDAVLSTIGLPGTIFLSGWNADEESYTGRMSFMETIVMLPADSLPRLRHDRTIIFYNTGKRLNYQRPDDAVDPTWGVICFPHNFEGLPIPDPLQIRITNAANYAVWQRAEGEAYRQLKEECIARSREVVMKIIGNYGPDVVYQDSFTPLTIERFTAKAAGAVYGSPVKIKSGRTPWKNLFIAGTDQGYLGIVGAMLSGVTIVNQHILQA